MDYHVKQAIEILKQGGIVVFPTDTAFGIGCRMDNDGAVQRLFAIRKRPETQAVPVLVSHIQMARKYVQPIPDLVIDGLTKRYWPGALTIVLPCRTERVPSLVRGGGTTLGIRIPDHQVLLAIIAEVGVPILGPSANFHGEPTPFVFKELNQDLMKMADFVLKGECSERQVSTVVDCSVMPWQILRQGAVAIEM